MDFGLFGQRTLPVSAGPRYRCLPRSRSGRPICAKAYGFRSSYRAANSVFSAPVILLIFLGSVLLSVAANDPEQPVALNAVGGAAVGLMAGLLGGWLPTLALFAIIGHRENAKRAEAIVVEEFITYWKQRTDARHALRSGRDARTVLAWLATFRLPLDDDRSTTGAAR